MTEQIAMNPEDYQCNSICPWLSQLTDRVVNKLCDFLIEDDEIPREAAYAYITPQGYETEEDALDNPGGLRVPIRPIHSRRRRPSRKRQSFIKYALPQYPSSNSDDSESFDSTSGDDTQPTMVKSMILPNTQLKETSDEEYMLV